MLLKIIGMYAQHKMYERKGQSDDVLWINFNFSTRFLSLQKLATIASRLNHCQAAPR